MDFKFFSDLLSFNRQLKSDCDIDLLTTEGRDFVCGAFFYYLFNDVMQRYIDNGCSVPEEDRNRFLDLVKRCKENGFSFFDEVIK